ncbi:hypothetical protein CANINC_003210 [Pichia inconspicua]|uniref:Uncharacterized protein n=1 Tax=Pichia inconspicua TaxID=52247 RepID=A0A4T0WZ92_9ASCO|nr:hypothetical protein CANINC_003210 [[Candida] inconspicua]
MYMIILTGFFLTKAGLFGVTTARACSDLVLLVFMPALVFDKIVSYISISDIKTIGVICFCAFIMYSINAIVALLIVKLTPVPKDRKNRWVGGAILAGVMQNVSDLPIAYIQAVSIFSLADQNKGTAYVIIWLAMYVLVQFNLGLFQLVEWDFRYSEHKDEDEEKLDVNNTESGTDQSHHSSDKHHSPLENHDNDSIGGFLALPTPNYELESIDSYSTQSPESDLQPHAMNDDNLDSLTLPNPIDKVSSRLSHLSRVVSRTNTIARIPSARSNNPNTNINDAMSLNEELIREYSRIEPYNQNMTNIMKIVTETNLTMKDVEEAGKNSPFVERYHLHHLVFFLQNFKKPNSIALVISLTLALIPWTKALFVDNGTVHLPNAPDKQPPLSFIIMYAEYLGYPCVPLGLLLVGSVLARLEFKVVPKGFWKSALCHTVYRLAILPIIGTAFITRLKNIGWLKDPIALFVCVMEFALPSATVQIYLTAGAMKPDDETCAPLNCFGLYLIMQYITLVISMPIVVCYAIKNVMGY